MNQIIAFLALISIQPAEFPVLLPSIDSQITFLYYQDVEAAATFYEKTLGLEKTFDQGWVKIYQTSSSASVGLVDGDRGYHRPATTKPVMLSLVTSNIESWFEYLKSSGAPILKPLMPSTQSPTQSFLVADPGGYTVEFFEWTTPPKPE